MGRVTLITSAIFRPSEIWLRLLRQVTAFQDKYESSGTRGDGCWNFPPSPLLSKSR